MEKNNDDLKNQIDKIENMNISLFLSNPNQERLTISNINSMSYSRPSIDSQNNIKINDSNLDFVSIDNSHIQKPTNRLFDEICSICSRKVFFIKYICAICSQCTLCEECEKLHLHPVIKFKQNDMSSLEDIYFYLKNHHMKDDKPSGFFEGLFKDKYVFEITSICNNFTMRRNQNVKLPVSIESMNNFAVEQKDIGLILLAKNMKDLSIKSYPIKNSFGRREKYTSYVDIDSGGIDKLHDFKFELYSSKQKVIEVNRLYIKIEINDDQEDEELNEFFSESPQIRFLDKERKGKIKEIMLLKIGIDNPILVKNILEDNEWNNEEAIKQIKVINDNDKLNLFI